MSGNNQRCGRYAPSPSGALHRGNLRTALIAWLQARLTGARFIIRMDDLDAPRNQPGAASQIIDDLLWLGLTFDAADTNNRNNAIVSQSGRGAFYQHAFETLIDKGLLYACRCSRQDIATALSAPTDATAVSVYPGTCRPLATPPSNLPRAAAPVAWRFIASDQSAQFEDQIAGRQHYNVGLHPGDFVVRRKDGIFAYQLASVVDDALLGITDVVRGADLLASTGRQIALFEALAYRPPRFWHVPLMHNQHGQKLAKRAAADSLQQLRQQGLTAANVIASLAASIGLIKDINAISANQLLQQLTSAELQQKLQRYRQ